MVVKLVDSILILGLFLGTFSVISVEGQTKSDDPNLNPSCPTEYNRDHRSSANPICDGEQLNRAILEERGQTCCCKQNDKSNHHCISWVEERNSECKGDLNYQSVDEPRRYCVCRKNYTDTMFCHYDGSPVNKPPPPGVSRQVEQNPNCRGNFTWFIVRNPDGKQCSCTANVTTTMTCDHPVVLTPPPPTTPTETTIATPGSTTTAPESTTTEPKTTTTVPPSCIACYKLG